LRYNRATFSSSTTRERPPFLKKGVGRTRSTAQEDVYSGRKSFWHLAHPPFFIKRYGYDTDEEKKANDLTTGGENSREITSISRFSSREEARAPSTEYREAEQTIPVQETNNGQETV
jgi:hypothetical protein